MGRQDYETETLISFQNTGHGYWQQRPIAQTVRTPDGGGSLEANLVTHSLSADGFDASEDGTGRGTPLVPVAFTCKDHGADVGEVSPTLRGMGFNGSHANGGGQVAIAIQERAICENPDAGPDGVGIRQDDTAYTVEARQVPQAVAYGLGEEQNGSHELMGCLKARKEGGGFEAAVAFNLRGRDGGSQPELTDVASVRSASGGSSRSYIAGMQVRRLTPIETARLQGVPDEHCRIPYKCRVMADGPIYKMHGNGFCVNVVRWIGEALERSTEPSRALREK